MTKCRGECMSRCRSECIGASVGVHESEGVSVGA